MYRNPIGKTLEERYKPLNNYVDLRKLNGTYPFNRISMSPLGSEICLTGSWADEDSPCINFGSQDYLGITAHPALKDAARQVIDEIGVSTGGTPLLGGTHQLTIKLERKVASILGTEQAQVYASGWSACFGGVSGLITPRDQIVMDVLMHNSSAVAAYSATEYVKKFKHNNMEDLEKNLKACRTKDDTNGLFVLVETLYSMNSDSPDLGKVYELCKAYNAILIIDTTHDLGCMGKNGLGLLESVDRTNWTDVVYMGSFSKVFGGTGGFVAGPRSIRYRIDVFSPSYTFASCASPITYGIVLKAFEIIFSEEGEKMRIEVLRKINLAINELNKRGFLTNGSPSPIIPIIIGDLKLGRLISREILMHGLIANLVEFPAVPKDGTIIRFQMMCTMSDEHIIKACEILYKAIQEAQRILIDIRIDSIKIETD